MSSPAPSKVKAILSKFKTKEFNVTEKQAKLYGGNNSSMNLDAKYVPLSSIVSPTLPSDKYRGGYYPVRILPAYEGGVNDEEIYTIFTYKFSGLEYKGQYLRSMHCAKTVDPNYNDDIRQLQRALYEDGSQKAKDIAKILYPKAEHYMNAIIRLGQFVNPQNIDEKKFYRNVGPRILILPDKTVKDKIWSAFSNPEFLARPTDLIEGYDFNIHRILIKTTASNGREVTYPNLDRSEFSRIQSPVSDNPEEIENWMENCHDLSKEYNPPDPKEISEVAQKIWEIYTNKASATSVAVNKPNASHEDGDDEEETEAVEIRQRKNSKVYESEDEPKRFKSSSKENVEEETPKKNQKPLSKHFDDDDDDEEEAPVVKRTKKIVNEEPEEQDSGDDEEENENSKSYQDDDDDDDDDWDIQKRIKEMKKGK